MLVPGCPQGRVKDARKCVAVLQVAYYYQVFHKVVQGLRKKKANTAKCVAVPPVALVN